MLNSMQDIEIQNIEQCNSRKLHNSDINASFSGIVDNIVKNL